MSCRRYKTTCEDKTFATCVTYEGNVSVYGELDSCDCHTLEDVVEDLVDIVDEIHPEVFLEDFSLDCINLQTEKDGTVKNSTVLKALGKKVCEIVQAIGLDQPAPCPGCGDPCNDTEPCCSGLITYKYSEGEVQITQSDYSNWAPIATYDINGVATSDGTYKVTLDVGCVEEAANSRCYIGIAVNNLLPVNSPFTTYFCNPTLNSKTFHFILPGIKKNDILKPMVKFDTGLIGIDGIKAIYEKV